MAKLYYQGHGSMRLTTNENTVVYIDPFAGKGYEKPADLILVSHEHRDHNAVELPAKKDDCRIIRADLLHKHGEYLTVDVKDVQISAVPAYNQNHDRDLCVGFIVRADGLALYFAGDTSKTDHMEKLARLSIDYAFLPIDGVYNMDTKEAAECAAVIAAKHTVPIHMKPGSLFDRSCAESFSCDGKLIMEPDEDIEL